MHIITHKEASELKGYKAMDLHVHTTKSHDVFPVRELTPLAQYEEGKKRGLDFITFTDHDNIAAYPELGALPDVVQGVEVSIWDRKAVGHEIHINVFQFNAEQYNKIMSYRANGDAYGLIHFLREQQLPFTFNHPYWCKRGQRFNEAAVEKLAALFPVIELSMALSKQKNDLALALAQRHGKAVVASTDSHIGDLGRARTYAQGETFAEWWSNVVAGNSYVLRKDMGPNCLVNEVNSRVELLFSRKMKDEELAVFIQNPKWGIPHSMIRLLFQFRKNRASGYIMKKSLITFSSSRVPAIVYMTRQWKNHQELKQKVKEALPVIVTS